MLGFFLFRSDAQICNRDFNAKGGLLLEVIATLLAR
jgi:hypothetical protein